MNKKKTALITGISGQDGSYLAEFLLQRDYRVVGVCRDEKKELPDGVEVRIGELGECEFIKRLLTKVRPDEIYNLAAQSSAVESWRTPYETLGINGLAVVQLFDVARELLPEARIFQASSSEMYGDVEMSPQDELTPFKPTNPYAVSKVLAHQMAGIYRKTRGQFISCGILYNHESPRRGVDFVTRKVALAAACLRLKISSPRNSRGELLITEKGMVEMGNLDAQRDWGYAPEYVEAMWRILQHAQADDYVIATGKLHCVRDLCEVAFKHVGLNWENYVVINPAFVRPVEQIPRVGNPIKIEQQLGWKAEKSFDEWIGLMVEEELNRLQQ